MKYFVFRMRWSVTDSDVVIVKAATEQQAKDKIQSNARYIELIATSDRVLT